MDLLFFFPTNKRSNSLETLMIAFADMGHTVHLLGMEEEGEIHKTVRRHGVNTHAHVIKRRPAFLYYVKHMLALRKFVKKNKIDIVYSHTQEANIISVFAQFGSNARYIICRHHSDYTMNSNSQNAKRFDYLINKLGKEFIVPSKKVYEQITAIEGVPSQKVRLINYAYDFSEFEIPGEELVTSLREQYPCEIRLVAVSRFFPFKRHDVMLRVFKRIVDHGLNARLILLGEGPLMDDIKDLCTSLELNDLVHFIGFTEKPLEYMAAADIVIHTSDSEASNSVIKEAGLLQRTILACRGVGDFSDYIVHGESGLLVSIENTEDEMVQEILKFSENLDSSSMGNALRDSVLKNFSSEFIIEQYSEVLRPLAKE